MSTDASVVVVNNADGRKYKMVMRGDLATLTAAKLKRYLHQATGAPPPAQRLSFNNRPVSDSATGDDLGLYDGAVFFLDIVPSSPPAGGAASPRSAGNASSARVVDETAATERLLAEKEGEARMLRQRLEDARERERLAARNSETSMERMERALRMQQSQIDELRSAVQHSGGASRHDGSGMMMHGGSSSMHHASSGGGGWRGDQSLQRSPGTVSSVERLRRNLSAFSAELRLPASVELDANHTAVVPATDPAGNEVSLLLTFDPTTERLYLYSTLLSHLPADPLKRLALYELILEGALLGREMAGGGVGVSVKSELVLLSVSVDLRHSDDSALAALAVPFLEAVQKWGNAVRRAAGVA